MLEVIRKKLEEKFTHVTFVKESNVGHDTVWYVNEDMQPVYVNVHENLDVDLYTFAPLNGFKVFKSELENEIAKHVLGGA